MTEITLHINKKEYRLSVAEDALLLDVLREDLGLTGTKRGCEVGECGACTVIMDGKTVNSCLVLAVQAEGSEIRTIEGVAENGKLHPVQQSFLEYDAVQCGFCTPGMVLSAVNLLEKKAHPEEAEIKEAIAGNLCRCTGYQPIVNAIKAAGDK
jgi:carbon-monoxide dehydrogenase small subunit